MNDPIQLTELAATKIKEAMSEESSKNKLRVGIQGGGCLPPDQKILTSDGFKKISDVCIHDKAHDFDFEFNQFGIDIVVDQTSAALLEGTKIDYVSGLLDSGFKFDTPRATTKCGCGSSFNIEN